MVLPSPDNDLLMLRPIGGSDLETTAIYLPLATGSDLPNPGAVAPPGVEDLGDLESSLLLYDAARLALRNGTGPFRSFGRLSVRPRSYQLIPLIMALRQEAVRLMIADDVGIGKTIEALLIARELLDRGVINSFAVICPPHLCEQWRTELQDKFGIEAEIIRSDTAARLDRRISGDASVFRHYPYQVISIDYIKSDQRYQLFAAECPDLVIVDEAHTCARPPGANRNQQLRHRLIRTIADRQGQHLLLLTATPHSGVEDSFHSLLGLLDRRFETLQLASASQQDRGMVAAHFVQRRRADVSKWLGEETPFPARESQDLEYEHAPAYKELFNEIVAFTRGYVRSARGPEHQRRFRYWTALGLLRGVMSSPAAGGAMLRRQAALRGRYEEITEEDVTSLLYDVDDIGSDAEPTLTASEEVEGKGDGKALLAFAARLEKLGGGTGDHKGASAAQQIAGWLADRHNPIIFCRFIATANYLADYLKPLITRQFPGVRIAAVTGELNDDQRRERIDELTATEGDGKRVPRVLVATDCLSEGINLQEHFTAILHYDLPWNPNRIEQREGRIDRFGQTAPRVQMRMLVGRDNPIDGAVLRVLLRKAREIRQTTGVSVAFPEESRSILDAVLTAVLFSEGGGEQLSMGLDVVATKESEVAKAMDFALGRETETRSVFAQNAIDPTEIERDLRETDSALGDPRTVERFVLAAVRFLGAQCDQRKRLGCFLLIRDGLPEIVLRTLPERSRVPITFHSPVAEGHLYIGRNHPFVEALCGLLFRQAFERADPGQPRQHRPARAGVIRTTGVTRRTTIVLLRVRAVVRDGSNNHGAMVAEEVVTWGYVGDPHERAWLDANTAHDLLASAKASRNTSPEERAEFLAMSLQDLDEAHDVFTSLTAERTASLIASHERYRKAVGGARYVAAETGLAPDVLGVFVLVPG